MRSVRILMIAIVTWTVTIPSTAQVPSSQRLQIAEKDGAYELSVPVSRLSLAIPKGQLLPSKSSADNGNPRYFLFEDQKLSLVISGWFEPEQSFNGMDSFWGSEQRSLTQNGIQIQNIKRDGIASWQVVLYDIQLPGGRSFNMRAECVQSETWIDVHMSVTGNLSDMEGEKLLRDTLGAIQVREQKQ
jgi:hypothetical protein